MGVWDRDYAQPERANAPQPWPISRPPPAALGLLVVHGLAFLIAVGMRNDAEAAASTLALHTPPNAWYAVLTHAIASANLISVLSTAYVIWALGGWLERRGGGAYMLTLYACAIVGAGVTYRLLAQTGMPAAELDHPLGVLASWAFVTARLARHEAVPLFGRVFTMPQIIGGIAALMLLFMMLAHGAGAGILIASAVAGAATAPLAIALHAVMVRKPRNRTRQAAPPPVSEPDIDDVLAKISRQGIDSLTADERRRLETARRAKLASRRR